MEGGRDGGDRLRSELIDLTGLDLESIAVLSDGVLAHALLRIHRQLESVNEPFYLGFQAGPPIMDTDP